LGTAEAAHQLQATASKLWDVEMTAQAAEERTKEVEVAMSQRYEEELTLQRAALAQAQTQAEHRLVLISQV
jgi:proteasome assembly chaperone (PAC2) family protein